MKSHTSLRGGLLIAAALTGSQQVACRAQAANVPFAGAWQRYSQSAGKTLNVVVSRSGSNYLAVQDYGIHHPGYKVQWTMAQEGAQLKGSHLFTASDMQAGGATALAISQLTGKLVAHLTLTLNSNGTLGQDEDLPHWFTNLATGQITRINSPGVNIVHSEYKRTMNLNERYPGQAEAQFVGAINGIVAPGTVAYNSLVTDNNPQIVFQTQTARLMTPQLEEKVNALAVLVAAEWPGTKLMINSSWANGVGHDSPKSIHYEGRATDLSIYPKVSAKLGRLAGLAVQTGFGWVWYEDQNHVHASVAR